MPAFTRFHIVFIASIVCLAGCTPPSDEAFLNRGDPASLLEVSTETQTVSIGTKGGVQTLARRLDQDHPTRAELNCVVSEHSCADAKRILEQKGVKVIVGDTISNDVTLVYDRIIARSCDAQFVNNTPNPYNLTSPSLGCSVASNMVQEVSDKRQFVNPPVSDTIEAKRGVNNVARAYKPRPVIAPYTITESITSSSSQ